LLYSQYPSSPLPPVNVAVHLSPFKEIPNNYLIFFELKKILKAEEGIYLKALNTLLLL
jgi:hypothetical protein